MTDLFEEEFDQALFDKLLQVAGETGVLELSPWGVYWFVKQMIDIKFIRDIGDVYPFENTTFFGKYGAFKIKQSKNED